MNKDITPFPWSVLGDRNGWLRIGHGTNCSIANVFEPPIGTQEANANLIAGSAALLAVSEEVLDWLCGHRDYSDEEVETMIRWFQKAINAANGVKHE